MSGARDKNTAQLISAHCGDGIEREAKQPKSEAGDAN